MVTQNVLHVLQPEIVHGDHVSVGQSQPRHGQILEQFVIGSLLLLPFARLLRLLVPVEHELALDLVPAVSRHDLPDEIGYGFYADSG